MAHRQETRGLTDEFVPPGHPLIGIRLHRCGGQPCLKGTRLPAAMIARRFADAGYEGVREYWGYNGDLPDELIDAAVAWEADPDHARVTRNALRRQRYAEDRWRWHRSMDES